MAEEGIMAGSSCCHGVQLGGVKGRGVPYFVNGPLASLDPPPSTLPTTTPPLFLSHPTPPIPQFRAAGCFCGVGMGTQEPGSKRVTFQHLALAAPLLLLSLRLDPPFLYSTPASLALLRFLSSPPTPNPCTHPSISGLLRFVRPLIFQHIHFILRPHSPSEVSPER